MVAKVGSGNTNRAEPSRSDARRNRDRLLDAAALVLARDQDPTLAEIAEVAELSRATAYRHFDDVAAVREALAGDAEQVGRDFLRVRLQRLFTGGDEAQAPVADQMTDLLVDGLKLRHRWTVAIASEPIQDWPMIETFSPIARGLIRRGQLRGEMRDDIDLDLASEALSSLSLYVARRVHRDGLTPEAAAAFVRPFLDGLAKGAQSRPAPMPA